MSWPGRPQRNRKFRPAATVLDTLAAAYAEAGRFKEAVETARRAKKAAEPIPNHDALLRGIDARLKLYESGKPYREAG